MLRGNSKATQRDSQPSCWALVPVDGRPIRDKARKEYRRAVRELEQARLELEQFEKTDRPQFQQWLNRACGALIAEIRELTVKYQNQRTLLFEVQSEALMADCSHARAYERVMRRQELQKEHAANGQGEDDAKHGGKEHRRHSSNPFEEFFGEEGSGTSTGQPPLDAPAVGLPQLKELYRALVRRLHPDRHGKLSPQRKEWWHQAQAAYQNGDHEQLQLLLTLCEIDDHGTTTRTSVSLLMRITRGFKMSLRTFRSRLSQFRRDPAWHFSSVQDRAPLLEQTERVLRSELFDLKRGLAAVEAQLESWARQARKPPGPRGRGHFQM